MTDLVPQYLDPTQGALPPRPRGMEVGDYPQQAHAARLAYWTIGVSTRAIRQPFGDAVGAPLHYEYDLSPSNLVAIDCRGDPTAPDDRSLVQIAQDNPPQVGRVFPTWFWHDWMHSTLSGSASGNRSLATKTANAYLGQQTRAGSERPVLAVASLAANGGTSLSSLSTYTLLAPGSATVAGRDCPLVAEDSSALAPLPLRVPCWVGRWGFPGATGQVLAGGIGSGTVNLGFFLKIKPLTRAFVENAAALKIAFTAQSAEYGCEVFGACAYTMAFLQAPASYQDPDYGQPGPPYPCRTYGDRCWKSREQTAYAQVFISPLGASWQAVVAVHQVRMERSAGTGRFVLLNNFVPFFYTQKASLTSATLPDAVSATVIAFGATTTISQTLFAGEADLVVQITVSATGIVTLCEARIIRNATVTNLGPGWHDRFAKL